MNIVEHSYHYMIGHMMGELKNIRFSMGIHEHNLTINGQIVGQIITEKIGYNLVISGYIGNECVSYVEDSLPSLDYWMEIQNQLMVRFCHQLVDVVLHKYPSIESLSIG